MNRKDTYKMLSLLQAFYPDAFRGLSDEAAQLKVSLWAELFAGEPGEEVLQAVKAYIATDRKGFMPVPGQIKAQLQQLRGSGAMTEQEAWSRVTKALRNSTYGAQEEFDALPPEIRRAVGSPQVLRTWAVVDVRELETVIASNFKRDYRAISQRQEELAMLPPGVTAATRSLPEGAGWM